MYQLSGGGYGGNIDHDGLANGCSTIGISKAPPIEIMERAFLFFIIAMQYAKDQAGQVITVVALGWNTSGIQQKHARFCHGSWPFWPPGYSRR